MKINDFAILLTAGVVCSVIGAGAGYYYGYDVAWEKAINASISSFEECIANGNAVLESHPRQCRTEDGRHFVDIVGIENGG